MFTNNAHGRGCAVFDARMRIVSYAGVPAPPMRPAGSMDHLLELTILPQPTDSSCGPTCLHAVYDYWCDPLPLQQVIDEVGQLTEGGTLAVHMACHALRRGYRATIYTYNLQLFDPTWFQSPAVDLAAKLIAQRQAKTSNRLAIATELYLRFLQLGGQVRMQPLDEPLILQAMLNGTPILSGLSATFLYQESREVAHPPNEAGISGTPDDVRGEPVGHFVVLCGLDPASGQVLVADPLCSASRATRHIYPAPLSKVTAAILLGIVTYDANLLIIEPQRRQASERA